MIREQVLKVWSGFKGKFNTKIATLNSQISGWQINYNSANEQLKMVRNQQASLQTNYNNISSQLITTRNELEKERSWWNKWMNDGQKFIKIDIWDRMCSCEDCNKIGDVVTWPSDNTVSRFKDYSGEGSDTFKQNFKTKVYQYYRDK